MWSDEIYKSSYLLNACLLSFPRKVKRFKAEVNVRFHHDYGVNRKKVQLSSGEVDISGSTSDL